MKIIFDCKEYDLKQFLEAEEVEKVSTDESNHINDVINAALQAQQDQQTVVGIRYEHEEDNPLLARIVIGKIESVNLSLNTQTVIVRGLIIKVFKELEISNSIIYSTIELNIGDLYYLDDVTTESVTGVVKDIMLNLKWVISLKSNKMENDLKNILINDYDEI